MDYYFYPPFFAIEPQTSFDEAWEVFCCEMLNLDNSTNLIRRRVPPDLGADLIWDEEQTIFQCKSVINGDTSDLDMSKIKQSIDRAKENQVSLGWQRYVLCTNVDLTGSQEQKLREYLPGIMFRTPTYWRSLCRKFPQGTSNRFLSLSIEGTQQTPIWSVPYCRNPFFTAREDILNQIHRGFHTNAESIRPLALYGLGGVGKTQVALEYAYRFQQEYSTAFWIFSENRETLISGFATIAQILNLPEKNEQEQIIIVQAVRHWFHTHTNWLLILDNISEIEHLKDFIPRITSYGHILITTHIRAIGRLAQPLEVKEFDLESGALFLLKRTGLLDQDASSFRQSSNAEQILACTISQELGSLPLALDQAGAYIEETQCGLQGYINIYQTHKFELLQKRGTMADDHPEPVLTTWLLSFTKVEQINPTAADLLRICAFLHPEAIPEDILLKGAMHLGPLLSSTETNILVFNQAIATLLSYSLVRRNNFDKTIFIHRLVCDAVRNNLKQEETYLWSEKVLKMLKANFPQEESTSWDEFEKLIPHITKYIDILWKSNGIHLSLIPDLPFLLKRAAIYLYNRARYGEAERLYLITAYIWEQLLGEENNPYLASTFNGLANLYKDLAEMDKAQIFYQNALFIWEKASGLPELEHFHEDIAHTFNGLANLYRKGGEFDTAILVYKQALSILSEIHEIKLLDKIYPLVGLAGTLVRQDKLEEAEKIYLELLDVYEQEQYWDNPDFAHVISGLATLYQLQERLEEAEQLYLNSLYIREKLLGSAHPHVATILNNLAYLYYKSEQYEKAEQFFLRAIDIYQNAYGAEHIQVSIPLFGLARIYYQRGNYNKAEELFLRTISIQEQSVGPENEQLLSALVLLSDVYLKEGKLDQAALFEKRSKDILKKGKQQRNL